jgi:PadR family transcriptional regulator PadR
MSSGASQPQRDSTELVVLSLLEQGPLYGYLISKQAAARSDGGMRLSPGVLYPVLAKLEKQGFITANWEEVKSERSEDDAAGRKRKWYRLTPKGRKRLAQQVAAHKTYLAMIKAFLDGSQSGSRAEGAIE